MTVLVEEAGGAARARRARSASASRGSKPVKPIRADITSAPRRPSPRMQRAMPTEKIHRGNYQAVILAEFVAAILLTAATPIASKRNQGGLSPYAAADMVQLGALTLLYFILALVSVGGGTGARLSAWFGGLILVGVGLGEAATIAKTFDLFGTTAGGSSAASAATAPASGPVGGPGQVTTANIPPSNPTVGGIT